MSSILTLQSSGPCKCYLFRPPPATFLLAVEFCAEITVTSGPLAEERHGYSVASCGRRVAARWRHRRLWGGALDGCVGVGFPAARRTAVEPGQRVEVSERIVHEPLVDDQTFVVVYGMRVAKRAKNGEVRRYLLAGLVVCGLCDRRWTGTAKADSAISAMDSSGDAARSR